MKRLMRFTILLCTVFLIFFVQIVAAEQIIVPDISGTWSGPLNNVGVEDYSTIFIFSQNGDQITGTATLLITQSNAYPQDVGKSFIYTFFGTVDANGNIHIIGDCTEAPSDIIGRSGHWDLNLQLSADGNTISFISDPYGTNLDMLLHRETPNPCPKCEVAIASSKMIGIPWKITHTRIVWTDKNGKKWYVEGNPGQACGDCASNVTSMTEFVPYQQEKDYTKPQTLLKGSEAQNKDQCIIRMAKLINSPPQCLCYHPIGPNSNSVTYTELLHCNVPLDTKKLYNSAQGWNLDLLPYIFP